MASLSSYTGLTLETDPETPDPLLWASTATPCQRLTFRVGTTQAKPYGVSPECQPRTLLTRNDRCAPVRYNGQHGSDRAHHAWTLARVGAAIGLPGSPVRGMRLVAFCDSLRDALSALPFMHYEQILGESLAQ